MFGVSGALEMSRIDELLSAVLRGGSHPTSLLGLPAGCSCHLEAGSFSRADILANSLKACRAEHGLTQAQLASAVGASRQLIAAIEGRKCLPSLPLAFKISRFLGRPIHDLFALREEGKVARE